ncbi:MAG: response regulator [Spirochaetia bacterium]|nr:response regulator [Spirochaetia bacterium]MBR4436284.1 response regulator [Spirochaetales bacterium]MBR5017187.1 response regulator [Spirochaetia bacterium]MBR5928051.1 response regulator [Spirochaetia bacterium]
MRLLMIDDEQTSFEIVKATIDWKSLDIVPEYAESAADAMEKIKEEIPDIVLTDIMMPGMDGFELIEWIKTNSYNCEIIILTAYGTFEYARKALDFGVTGYLLKPLNEAELKELINKAIYNISQNSRQAGHLNSVNYSLPVRLACEYIDKNYQEDINLNKISNYVSLSKNYFCNIFKKETGMTIWDYLIRIRMEEAKKMLLETEQKTYEISERVGYDDPSYFGRLFKKYTGFTPIEFRDSSR